MVTNTFDCLGSGLCISMLKIEEMSVFCEDISFYIHLNKYFLDNFAYVLVFTTIDIWHDQQ